VRAEEQHVLRSVAEPASLERVHDLLGLVWVQHPDVSADDRMRFELAVTEIAGNIVEHAGDPGPIEFQLGVLVYPDRLEARFLDPGRRMVVDFSSVAMPDGLAESGRGLALALAVSDELTYRNDGAANHWLIVRRRTAD
jgi:serine/threonine-protein kinase RsbW